MNEHDAKELQILEDHRKGRESTRGALIAIADKCERMADEVMSLSEELTAIGYDEADSAGCLAAAKTLSLEAGWARRRARRIVVNS